MKTYDETPREFLGASLAPEAPLSDALRWAVAHACLAPSELNSQPWCFRGEIDLHGETGTLELFLDGSRRLPTIDPSNREAVLACGAALLNLRLALRGAALGTSLRLCPDPHRPELLAQITVAGQADERDEDRLLRLAIPLRRTHRAAFEPSVVPSSIVSSPRLPMRGPPLRFSMTTSDSSSPRSTRRHSVVCGSIRRSDARLRRGPGRTPATVLTAYQGLPAGSPRGSPGSSRHGRMRVSRTREENPMTVGQ